MALYTRQESAKLGFDVQFSNYEEELLMPADVRAYLRNDLTIEDEIIQRMITAVTRAAESAAGICLQGKTVTVYWEQVPEGRLALPYGPVKAVSSVQKIDPSDGSAENLAEDTDYWLEGLGNKKLNWITSPAGYGVKVVYTVQQLDTQVRALAREAMLTEVADWFNTRGSVSDYQAYKTSIDFVRKIRPLMRNPFGI